MKLACVIMAAGSSRRFGANKLLQDFSGRPLYRWALEAVPPEVFGAVCVVTGYGPVAEAAAARGYGVVINDRPELGISRTIRLGLEQTSGADGVLFMTADQPLLTAATVRRLAEVFLEDPSRIVAAACGGERGNPCLFPGELLPELERLQGDTGGAGVIRAHPERLRTVEVPRRELADCDTAEMLRNLEATEGSPTKSGCISRRKVLE